MWRHHRLHLLLLVAIFILPNTLSEPISQLETISLDSDEEYLAWLASVDHYETVPNITRNASCVPTSSKDRFFTIDTPRDIFAPFFWECIPIDAIVRFYEILFYVCAVGMVAWVGHIVVYSVRVKSKPNIGLIWYLTGIFLVKLGAVYYHWTVGWIDLTKRDAFSELDPAFQYEYSSALISFWLFNNISYGLLFGLFTILAKGMFVLRKDFERREWTSIGIIIFGACICYSQMFYVGRYWTNGNLFLVVISVVTIRVILALRQLNFMAILLYRRRLDGVKIVSKKIRGSDVDQLVDEPASSVFNGKIRLIQWFTIASTVYLGTTVATEILRRGLPLAAPIVIMEISSTSLLFFFGFLYRLQRETVYTVGLGSSAQASTESLNDSQSDLGLGPFITQLRTLVSRIRRPSEDNEQQRDEEGDDEPAFASRSNIALVVPSNKHAGKQRLMYAYHIGNAIN